MKKIEREEKKKSTNIFTVKVPIYYFLVFIIVAVLTILFFNGEVGSMKLLNFTHDNVPDVNNSSYDINRLPGYKFIKPLLSAKPGNEYEGYSDIKKSVTNVIQQYKNEGAVKDASVYLLDLDRSNWISINNEVKYLPGSILKITILITYLKMEEKAPGVLDKKITYNSHFQSGLAQDVTSKGIEFGKTYSVKQLLEYMIEYSDNNANFLLVENMNWDLLNKLYTDIGLTPPDMGGAKYQINVKECSQFMEVLFNSTYLDAKYSEYAINLLTKSNYMDGIVKGIPEPNLIIAHKFGEAGTKTNHQLHETAILYIEDKPYLLTIMTIGNDNIPNDKLAEVIRHISGLVYSSLEKSDRKA